MVCVKLSIKSMGMAQLGEEYNWERGTYGCGSDDGS